MLPWECSVLSVTLIRGKKAYRDTEKQNNIIHGKKYIRFDNKESIYMVLRSQRRMRYPLHVQKSFYREWLLQSLENCHRWPLFPEPVLLSDDTIGKTGVLKYNRTAWYKELNETASLRNKNAVVCFDDGQYNHLFRKQTCAHKATPIWFFQQNKM